MFKPSLLLMLFASSTAIAGPTVAVLEFRGEGLAAGLLTTLADDVRGAAAPVVASRGGIVLANAAMAPRQDPPTCGTQAQCDIAYARSLRADLFIVGTSVVVDGAPSLSIQVIGCKSGNVLMGKRVEVPKTAALLRATPATVASLLEEIFDRHGPPKVGTAAAAPVPVEEDGADTIMHTQGANLFRGSESVGGQVTVTRRTIRFEAHAMNIQGGAELIRIDDVIGMERVPTLFINNGVVVRLRSGGEKRFVLQDRERFIQVVGEQTPGRR